LPSGKAPMPGALPPISGQGRAVAATAPEAAPTMPPPVATSTMAPAAAPVAPPPASAPMPPRTRSMTTAALTPPPRAVTRPIAPSDAALGFQPSHAPALDPTIAQFVSPAVLSRYQQTAEMAAAPGVSYATPADDPPRAPRRHSREKAMGGPE